MEEERRARIAEANLLRLLHPLAPSRFRMFDSRKVHVSAHPRIFLVFPITLLLLFCLYWTFFDVRSLHVYTWQDQLNARAKFGGEKA